MTFHNTQGLQLDARLDRPNGQKANLRPGGEVCETMAADGFHSIFSLFKYFSTSR
jgi:hypothetical protein